MGKLKSYNVYEIKLVIPLLCKLSGNINTVYFDPCVHEDRKLLLLFIFQFEQIESFTFHGLNRYSLSKLLILLKG